MWTSASQGRKNCRLWCWFNHSSTNITWAKWLDLCRVIPLWNRCINTVPTHSTVNASLESNENMQSLFKWNMMSTFFNWKMPVNLHESQVVRTHIEKDSSNNCLTFFWIIWSRENSCRNVSFYDEKRFEGYPLNMFFNEASLWAWWNHIKSGCTNHRITSQLCVTIKTTENSVLIGYHITNETGRWYISNKNGHQNLLFKKYMHINMKVKTFVREAVMIF